MAITPKLLSTLETIRSYTKHGVEACGRHPFVTGLFAILGIMGLVLSIVDYNKSRIEENNTTTQIEKTRKELSNEIKKSTEKIVNALLEKHRHELEVKDEQLKALAQAVTTISSKTELIGSKEEREAALKALAEGETKQAKQLFINTIEKGEQEAQRLAKNYQDLGALAFLDNTKQALDAYKRATELGSSDWKSWNQLGHLYRRTGDLEQAISAYNKVLNLAKEQKNDSGISVAYGNLGNVYQTRGDLGKAIAFHQKALTIHETLGHKEGMASDYGYLGNVYQTRGKLDKAIEFHQKALTIHEALGNKEGMASDYGNLGIVYRIRGKLDKAIEFHQKSLAIEEALGRKEGMASEYGNLGNVYQTRGELDKAIEFYQKSLVIEEALGRKEGMASDYGNLGIVYKTRGELDKARKAWEKSLQLFKALQSPNAKLVQSWLDDSDVN